MVNFQRYAVQDWSGEQGDSKFSSPLNFQRGDIIAAFEIDGILRFSFQFRNFGVSFLYTISNLIITPVCNHCGVIITIFISGVMHGYLRGAHPVDGSVEQVIRDGQFPQDAVEEVRQNSLQFSSDQI